GVLRTLLLSRLKLIAGILLPAGTLVAGAAVVAQQQDSSPRQAAPNSAADRVKRAFAGIPRVDRFRADPDAYLRPIAPAPKRPLKYVPPPAPRDIPVNVAGRALDTADQPVRGATVYLMEAWPTPKVVSKTTTDDDGRYVFRDARVPVTDGSVNGVKPSFPP